MPTVMLTIFYALSHLTFRMTLQVSLSIILILFPFLDGKHKTWKKHTICLKSKSKL